MNTRVFLMVAVLGFAGALPSLAQAAGGAGGRMSFLSADDRRHFMRVRQQVLSENPDLKTEQESLTKEREFVKNKGTGATQQDRETLRNNFMAHSEKMEAAMIKDDPSVQPIIDQVKAHIKERIEEKQGGAAAGQGTSGDDSSSQ